MNEYSGLNRECCLDGMRQVDGYSCLYRSNFIVDGQECKQAFLHCCNKIIHQAAEAETELTLARSKFFLTAITLHLQFFWSNFHVCGYLVESIEQLLALWAGVVCDCCGFS